MAANYTAPSDHSPYGSGDPYYNESTGYITPHPAKKAGVSNWIKIGVPVAVLVIVGAVVGGVLGSRKTASSSSASGGGTGAAASVTGSNGLGRFASATNSLYLVPLYPSTTNTAAFTTPTFNPSNSLAWPQDPFQPSAPSVLTTRPDRPLLIAPAYKWQALSSLIKSDPYLSGWNDTIFGNATQYFSLPPAQYFMDGDSGILDNSRDVKRRIKAFGYAYRMSNDTKWADRAMTELMNAAGSSFGPNDNTKWNPQHFLDTAEMSSAFGIAYDWFYDHWSDAEKQQILSALIQYGLQPGLSAYIDTTNFNGWWKTNTTGNWNCVCNAGLTLASLAILADDTTGVAKQLLGLTVDNAKQNCAYGVTSDGSWTETPNYWYFGTTGHAEMAAALISATGSDYNLLDVNPNFYKTGLYHMYAFGPGSLFSYGDHGPNKYSSTANGMFLYGSHYQQPQYTLFQREQFDAAEPWSMFWYDPTISGAFWDGMPLDHFFDDGADQWGSMRSTWTDENALYVAIKAGTDQGHQTHNDLDAGTFVVDALGTRWAGELGSGDYRSPFYFSNDTQDSERWLYYRKRTEGQNTLLIGSANQNVLGTPSVNHGTSNTSQGSSTVFTPPQDSTAYWTTDLTSSYFNVNSVKRGIRMINGRRQVLLQDEINSQSEVMWRMHTNATIVPNGQSATLTIDGKTMQVSLLNAPSGASFSKSAAVRLSSDPTPPEPDQSNDGVNVLIIDLPAGTYTLQVLFNPQWSGMSSSAFVTPPSVPLDNWSLTSHS